MKALKITYWTVTVLISAMMLMSVYMYLTSAQIAGAFMHLGYPQYFRVELAIAKLIGVILLIIPVFKGRIKEWAYAGFFITFVSALIAHTTAGDPVNYIISVLFAMVLLVVSYITYHKTQAVK
jgi:hypothetical protein